jgi:nucleoside-diphosphate-sugar epimerase
LKVLFIGGTGNISTSVSKLCVENGIDLYLLNRGIRGVEIPGAKLIRGDISKVDQLAPILNDHKWDAVVNWIVFTENEVERDINLFKGKTKQYIFISSASAYQKPPVHPVITESTPLYNPFWEYSRNKIACEERLNRAYREDNFPVTIVRPSLTYDTVLPVALGGWMEYNIINRLKKGEKIIVHGDGTSLWTITHAEDFAKGFVGLIGHQQATGHSFHITSDEILTWNQIYQAVADAVGVEPNIIHIPSDFICRVDETQTGTLLGDKALSVIFDNSKIKMFVPGFKAVIPFSQGIKRTLAWFDADPKRRLISKKTDEMMDKIIKEYEKK